MGRAGLTFAMGAVAVGVVACTGSSHSAPTPHRIESAGTAVTKLLAVVVENHSFDQMRDGMPHTFSLARRFGYATNYRAMAHPSLPNYIAITSGSRHDIRNDGPPSEHPLRGSSVFGRALRAGKTATVYAESMPTNCATTTTTGSGYLARHNPLVYFISERHLCLRHDQPLSELFADIAAGRLPNVGMIVPNSCNDAHDCSLERADDWLQHLITALLRGPDWRSGHLAVIITADEDDHSQGNKVLTVVIHPTQRHTLVPTRLTHYSLTRLYEDVAGLTHRANATSAPSMTAAFALPVR